MRIGISINEVLRDFIGHFIYTYEKYIDKTDVKPEDITTLDLTKYFDFKSIDDLNRFMYLEAPLEIFGHADQLYDGLINQFNLFLMNTTDDGEHQVELVSREVGKSIPATFFFLSKTGCKVENVRFVTKSIDEWNGVDVLITANPDALANKPNGKISIKINSTYNKDVAADFALDSISDFINDESLRNKILNSKTITYEEI